MPDSFFVRRTCTYLCYDALFPRLPKLIPGNEPDVAIDVLPGWYPALPALQWVRKCTSHTEWGALSLHLLCLPSQVAILRVQMTRYTWHNKRQTAVNNNDERISNVGKSETILPFMSEENDETGSVSDHYRKDNIKKLCQRTASYLVRWNHECDEHPCRACGVDYPYHEAWLDLSDLKQSLDS